MSAAARAEARRKAILGRGTDRLAKLATSARREDATAFGSGCIGITARERNFLGEETADMPNPRRLTPSPTPSPLPPRPTSTGLSSRKPLENAGAETGSDIDPSAWTPEQQRRFMQALMGASEVHADSVAPPPSGISSTAVHDNISLAASLFSHEPEGFSAGIAQAAKPLTRLQSLMPLIHLISSWCLLAYFVLWREPQANGVSNGGIGRDFWRRWGDLGWKNPWFDQDKNLLRVGRTDIQLVPFIGAFTALQIALHSLRIFSGFDTVQPPALLSLAFPHLPRHIPSIIIHFLKYAQVGSLFLDDLAAVVVGLGLIVSGAGILTS